MVIFINAWVRKDPVAIRLLNVYYHWLRPYWCLWLAVVVVFGTLLLI